MIVACPDCGQHVAVRDVEMRIGRTVWYWLSCGHRSLPVRTPDVARS